MLDNTRPPARLAHGAACGEAGLRRTVERLLREETDRLGLTPEARARLLPPHLRAVVVEVVTRTLLQLEGRAAGEPAGEARR